MTWTYTGRLANPVVSGVAAGNVVIITGYGPTQVTSVTDPRANTYSLVGNGANNGSLFINMVVGYLATPLQAGDTFSISQSGSFSGFWIDAFSTSVASPVDVSSLVTQTSGNSSVALPSTGALAAADDLYYMSIFFGAAPIVLTDTTTGLSALPDVVAGKARYKSLASSSAVNYQGTSDLTQTYGGYLVTVKAAAAAPSTPSVPGPPALLGRMGR